MKRNQVKNVIQTKKRESIEVVNTHTTSLRKENGITLIALVITIIVLLILAGVTIAALSGDNGILQRATEAKEQTVKTSNIEEIELAKSEMLVEYGATGTSNSKLLSNGNTVYIDTNGEIAIIPNGFVVSGINAEQKINDGLVIYEIPESEISSINWTIDSDGDGMLDVQKQYNQFVWIPVKNENEYIRNTTYRETIISETVYTDTQYLPDGIQPAVDNSDNNEQAEKDAVLNVGGFYISRYEAGREENNVVVSKKGIPVFNEITQDICKSTAKMMYNTKYAKTALCSGIQWDVVMNFVNGKLDGVSKEYDVTGVSYDRHTESSTPETTGQNEADRVCNIYDLEGNCYEYIAERNSYDEINNPYVGRGGHCQDHCSASNRYGLAGQAEILRSFRISLYVI